MKKTILAAMVSTAILLGCGKTETDAQGQAAATSQQATKAITGRRPDVVEEIDTQYCRRRSKSEPPCRLNIEPGVEADVSRVGCG